MKSKLITLLFVIAGFFPSFSYAKGIPLFLLFNTGDEVFEVNNAPDMGDGFKLGYACKHFGLFGADIWSWDCEMMGVKKANLYVTELETDVKEKYQTLYPLSSRERDFLNHYGIVLMIMAMGAYGYYKTQTD